MTRNYIREWRGRSKSPRFQVMYVGKIYGVLFTSITSCVSSFTLYASCRLYVTRIMKVMKSKYSCHYVTLLRVMEWEYRRDAVCFLTTPRKLTVIEKRIHK